MSSIECLGQRVLALSLCVSNTDMLLVLLTKTINKSSRERLLDFQNCANPHNNCRHGRWTRRDRNHSSSAALADHTGWNVSVGSILARQYHYSLLGLVPHILPRSESVASQHCQRDLC